MRITDNISCRCELRDIAFVQSGYLSRSKVLPLPSGTHRLLRVSDVSPDGVVDADTAIRFQPQRNPELYRISRGDILIVARGEVHYAYLISMDLINTLASSVFHIIRPRKEIVLPDYLAWWLNQPDVQAEINLNSRGTGIGYVSRQDVEHLTVVLPPINVQNGIVKTINLWQLRKEIQTRLDGAKEKLIQAICRQILHQGKE